MVYARFVWSGVNTNSPHFEQAFSADGPRRIFPYKNSPAGNSNHLSLAARLARYLLFEIDSIWRTYVHS